MSRIAVVLLLAAAAWAGEFEIPTPRGPKLKAVLHEPETANDTVVVIAPGQGHHMDKPLIKGAAEELARRGYRAIRFNWAFFTAGGKPSPGYANEVKDIEAVLAHARGLKGVEQVVLAGKSLGSLAGLFRAAKKSDDLAALALLTLPVHQPNQPTRIFAEMRMLNALTLPVLVMIGHQDHLCAPESLYRVVAASKVPPRIVVLAGGHSFDDRGPDPARTAANTRQAIATFAHWVDDVTRPAKGEAKDGLRIDARFDRRTGVFHYEVVKVSADAKPVEGAPYLELRRKWGGEWERLERKEGEPGNAVRVADFKWPTDAPPVVDLRIVLPNRLVSGAFRHPR